ncbi:hypothetical protein, partial [Lederbergia graminis]
SSCPPFKWFLGRKHCITGHGDDLFFLHNYMDLIGKWTEVVTMEVAACPVEGKIEGVGHVGARIVPG